MGYHPDTPAAPTLDDLCDAASPSGMTRRSFLATANALALVVLLEACTGKHHPAAKSTAGSTAGSPSALPAAASSAASSPVFDDVLALLRQAVQASPDYLQQAAAKAVATKDVTAIDAFVRDHITVIPSWNPGDDPISTKRWGSRATLRGGSGTVRDRADLLVDLLTAAGFTATVMSADLPSEIDLATLYQLRAADFDPDETLLAKAAALLPAGSAAPAVLASPNADQLASQAETAAKALAAVIPAATQVATISKDLLPASVPVVVVGAAPTTASASPSQQYLFALGNMPPSATAPSGLGYGGQASPTTQVTVTVSGLTNPPPGSTTPHGEVVQLVTATWLAEEVFGRQVLLTFVPPSGAGAFLTGAPTDQPVRVPTLHIQSELPAYAAPPIVAPSAAGSTSPPSAASSLASPAASAVVNAGPAVFTGAPITFQGDVLNVNAGSSSTAAVMPQGAYGPLTTLTATQRSAAIASAATLHATANATTFPEIELDVSVLDNSGSSVDGLDAAAFAVTDNGSQVPWVELMSNSTGPDKPRVLVIYDTTGSVADTWPSPAAKAAFEQSLATTLVAAAQQTPFDVQILGLNEAGSPDPTKWVAPDQAGLLTAFANAGGDNSVVWASLSGGGIDQGVVAMLMVSDFQSEDELPADIATAQRRIAAAHIPIFCLTVGTPDATAVSLIVSLSGGTQLDPLAPSTASALAALINPLVAARTMNTYRIRYVASKAGSTTHTVTVKVAGRSTPVATATYTVPAAPATPWSFAGLYVTVSIASLGANDHHIAGLNLSADGNPRGDLDDPAAAAETRAAISGVTTIAIEPGTVTTAALADDFLSSVQSFQRLLELPKTATVEQVQAIATKYGVRRVPPLLMSLLQPPTGTANPNAVRTMRVAVYHERATASATDNLATRLDLPPALNTIAAIGADPRASFAAGLTLSTQAAAAEAANFDSSAFTSLTGLDLTFIGVGDSSGINTFVATLPAADQPAWEAVLYSTFYQQLQHIVVPTGGTTAAFWVIDAKTGAATAMLLDGSGGARSDAGGCTSADFGVLLNLLNGLLSLFSIGCTFAGFTCLGPQTAEIYLITGLILAVVGGIYSGNFLGAIASVAALAIPFNVAGNVAKLGSVVATVANTVDGYNTYSCPPGAGEGQNNGAPAANPTDGAGQNGDNPTDGAGQNGDNACGVDDSDDGVCQ
jgi:hypothetical protein